MFTGHNYLDFPFEQSVNVHAESKYMNGEDTNMASITFKVYMNENDQAVYAGDVTAPSYQVARDFVLSEGYDEMDFVLVKADD